jgi:hypothetical protein
MRPKRPYTATAFVGKNGAARRTKITGNYSGIPLLRSPSWTRANSCR